MPATSKGYSAEDEADVASGTIGLRAEEAIARFLQQTDHLLAVVVAALVICVGFIAFSNPARAATQVQQMLYADVQRITGCSLCQPGTGYTATHGSAITFS